MYAQIRPDHGTGTDGMARVAELLGISTAETVRKRVRQAEIDHGARPGISSEESVEVKRLLTADLVLDAIEQAIWNRRSEGRDQFDALVGMPTSSALLA